MKSYLLIMSFTCALRPAISGVTMTVTNDIVFSGDTATLTCSVTADNGETVIVNQWKDSSDNIIGNTAGDFEKNDVSYKIFHLLLEANSEQVISWAIEVELLTLDMSLKCWALVGGQPYEETGQIDVVGITSSNTVTLTGESTSVTCSLTGASSEANTTVQWSQHGSPITGEEGSYSLSTEYSGTDKVEVLTASNITSDETFTCTFSGTEGGSVSSTVNIDHVTITPSSYNVTRDQNTGTLSCVLSGANQAPIKTKWLRSDESEITGTDPGFEFYSSVPYENGEETFLLFVDPATESSAFTCCFEFSGNVSKRAVAHMEVTREHSGTKDDLQVAWMIVAGVSLLGNVLFAILATLTWIKWKHNRGVSVDAEHEYIDNVIPLKTSAPSTTIRPEEPFYDTMEIEQI